MNTTAKQHEDMAVIIQEKSKMQYNDHWDEWENKKKPSRLNYR